MPYATPETVRQALSPEGDTSSATAASLTDEQLNDAISEATSEIDSMVKGAPFADNAVPTVVSAIARDVAAYLATLSLRKNVEVPNDHPVALRYRRAEALLTAAAKGQLDLSGDPEATDGEPFAQNMYEGDLFTLEGMGLGPSRDLPPWMR
jgi:phage gp36-like protein